MFNKPFALLNFLLTDLFLLLHYLCTVLKLAAILVILVHIHHSIVMIVGDILQVKVVAAAKAAGIPFFDHQGEEDQNTGQANDEALEIEKSDFCAAHDLVPKAGENDLDIPLDFSDHPSHCFILVYPEILTPPPQARIPA